jgi:hypothetical protein
VVAAEMEILDFDCHRLFRALDDQRLSRGMSWRQVATDMWQLSAELNRRRDDHPVSPSTITNVGQRGATSCQHALFFLRWLGRTPESFLGGGVGEVGEGWLPPCGVDRRLRWDLAELYQALNEQRLGRSLTWAQLARQLRVTPNQLTGLRTARFATGINVAMHVVQWLERPASDFIYAARW